MSNFGLVFLLDSAGKKRESGRTGSEMSEPGRAVRSAASRASFAALLARQATARRALRARDSDIRGEREYERAASRVSLDHGLAVGGNLPR